MLTPQDLERFIQTNNIEAEIVYLSDEVPTVLSAAEAVGGLPQQIGKSILFMVRGGDPVLVVANGEKRVSQKLLANFLGVGNKRVRLAKEEQVLEVLGYVAGTVPPFGHKIAVRTLLESSVMLETVIFVGGGGIRELLRIDVKELHRVLQADVVSLG
jgi:prolyl-tRNA editing enzyme YbaK/EbsC (Cys-tRNA(Pro) deacylase)